MYTYEYKPFVPVVWGTWLDECICSSMGAHDTEGWRRWGWMKQAIGIRKILRMRTSTSYEENIKRARKIVMASMRVWD